jgi:cell division septation protein DedD
MVAIALGIIAIIWGIFQKVKAGRVADAPLASTGDAARRGGEVASPKGAISAQGRVVCAQPLVSPVTGTPCLYYRLRVTASWKEGNVDKKKELNDERVAATFAIDDGSGPVHVDARKGGDFEPSQVKDETKGTGLLGGITGKEIEFGNYRVSAGMLSLGTKYNVREEVLPLQPSLYVCGKAEQGAIVAPGWRSLIVSNKTRDELLGHATKSAKASLLGGLGAFVAGGALAIVGTLLAPPPAAADPAQLTAAASTAPAASSAPAAATASSDLPAAPIAAATTTTHAASPKPAPKPASTPKPAPSASTKK